MSFNNLNYDTCTYKHNLRQSVGVFDYLMTTPSSCECRVEKPYSIDLDSELIGITRQASNCPDNKHLPTSGGKSHQVSCIKDSKKICKDITKTHTRLDNPACTLRGSGWNRWEWLPKNPQDKTLVPFDYNISNRIIVKDNHRPVLHKPLDQQTTLPQGSEELIKFDLKTLC